MSQRHAVSAVLITRDEERRLERALVSLAWADEIVVLDSGSRDRTVEIAYAHGARVDTRVFDNFAAQRNAAAALARHAWIFMMDADEEVTPALRDEIQQLLRGEPRASAYLVPRWNILFGKLLRHGGHSPDLQPRLFHRGRAHYVGEVHERLQVEGKQARLRGRLIHHGTATIGEYLGKLQHYTDLEAKELYQRGGVARAREQFVLPILWFLRAYFLQRGLLDGWQGYLDSMLGSFYVFIKHAKRYDAALNTRPQADTAAGPETQPGGSPAAAQ
jgi:glycosyltransferase involved in cell wall biosynthesis